jgi:hypothetical protein
MVKIRPAYTACNYLVMLHFFGERSAFQDALPESATITDFQQTPPMFLVDFPKRDLTDAVKVSFMLLNGGPVDFENKNGVW